MMNSKNQFIVDDNGEKTAVIIPIEDYERLLEDLADLAVIAERREEPGEPLEVVTQRLERKWQSSIA